MKALYYNRKGEPIYDTMEWAKLFNDRSYQILKQTDVGAITISTVWLGLDHSYGEGPPIIFETMAFVDFHKPGRDEEGLPHAKSVEGPEGFEFQERYATEEEALAGHERAVQMARRQLN